MTKYRLKPENVEAVKFRGSNWYEIVRLLGPHLTKVEQKWEDVEEHSVFDIASKQWRIVEVDNYVVRFTEGNLDIVTSDEFEARWEEEPAPSLFPPTYPNYPNLGGGIVRYH